VVTSDLVLSGFFGLVDRGRSHHPGLAWRRRLPPGAANQSRWLKLLAERTEPWGAKVQAEAKPLLSSFRVR
jgi:hypothetical protein